MNDDPNSATTAIRNIQILDNVFRDNPDNLYLGNALNVIILRNKFGPTMRTTINKVKEVTIGYNMDASGDLLQNVANLLNGTHDEAEIIYLPQAPVLAAFANKTVDELTPLTFTATAADADIPAQTLTFSLGAGAPAGASITAGGVFTWTPTEAQGPGTTTIGITVSDGGASFTKSFTVTVTGTPQQTWRQQHCGSAANSGDGADSANPDGDSFTNGEEYVHGTLPTTSTANPLQISRNGQNLELTFEALRAEGPHYGPLTQRIYDLQTTIDLSNPASWQQVDGYSNIVGNNQTRIVTLPIVDPRRFYRLQMKLE